MKNTEITVPILGESPIEKIITQQYDTNIQLVVVLTKNDEPYKIEEPEKSPVIYLRARLPSGKVVSRTNNSWVTNNWAVFKIFSDMLSEAGIIAMQVVIKYTTYHVSSALFYIDNRASLERPNWPVL